MFFFNDVMNHPLEAAVVFSFGLMFVVAIRWKTKRRFSNKRRTDK